MVALPCCRFSSVARWNGQAPQITTTQVRANEIHCHQGNCQAGTIAITITGRLSAAVMISRQRRAVTGLFDRLDQGLRRGAAGCVDRRLLRRVIDGGVDTFESVELLLDS